MSFTIRQGLPLFFFSSRRRHTRLQGDWSSDVCSSDLRRGILGGRLRQGFRAAGGQRRQGGKAQRDGGDVADHEGVPSRVWVTPSQFRRRGIGRAAGRGRGEVSVGAGSFKKKKGGARTE